MSPHQPPWSSFFRSDFGLSSGASLRCSLKDLPLTSKSGLCVLPQCTILSHHTLSHPVAVIVCWYLPLKCASRNLCLFGLTVYPQDLEQCLAHIRISINMYWMTNWRHTPCLKEAFNLESHSNRFFRAGELPQVSEWVRCLNGDPPLNSISEICLSLFGQIETFKIHLLHCLHLAQINNCLFP